MSLRTRVPVAYACVLAIVAVALSMGLARGASSNVVVSVDIPSSTTLVTTSCAPNTAGITDFGVVTPGSIVKTTNDCTVTFGSSNDSASLRMTQSDGTGSAMGHPTDAWTRHTGSGARIFGLSHAGGTIWAAGANGTSYRSLDAGVTWVERDVNGGGSSANIGSVSQATASASWMAGGGEIWRTTQADQACAVAFVPCWSQITTLTGANAVAATSANTAWVAGTWVDNPGVDSHLHYTANGGGTWTPITPVLTPGLSLELVRAFDANTVVAWRRSNPGAAMATHDGTTWRSLNVTGGLRDLVAITDSLMIGLGQNGTIVRTTNAMAATPTWTSINAGTRWTLQDIECIDLLNCIAVGDGGAQAWTDDAGLTWTASDLDTSYNALSMERISSTTFVVGSTGDTMLRTTNSGTDWTITRSDTDMWWDVAATVERRAWRVGNDGLISRSVDNGVTWTAQTPETGSDLFGVHAFDTNRAIAVGRGGTVMRTTNGGTTWSPATSQTTNTLWAVAGVSDGHAWAVGDGGVVIRTGDYGATWQQVASNPAHVLTDVVALQPDLAFATGRVLASAAGVGIRTTDGMTFAAFTPPDAPYAPTAIAGVENTSVATLLVRGGTYRTTDGGATWTPMAPPGSENNTVDLAMPTTDIVFGTAIGSIRRSSNGGASFTGIGVPFHHGTAVDAYDRTRIVSVGDGGTTGTTGSANDVDNYVQNTSDWIGDGTEAFGVCLRTTTANATWTPNGTCDQSADGAHWRAVPTLADSSAEVASTGIGDGPRAASFRFGLRIAPTEPPGELSAGITFLVIAPDV